MLGFVLGACRVQVPVPVPFMACLGAISGRSREVLPFRFGLFKVTACAMVHVSL